MNACAFQVLSVSSVKCKFPFLLANRGNRLEDHIVISLSPVTISNLLAVHIALLSFLFGLRCC